MREENKFYNEPEMDIVRVFANGDVVTLSSSSNGTPDSDNFDDMFNGL